MDGHSIDCLHQTHPTVTTGGQMLWKDPPPLPIGFRKLIFPAHHGPYKLFHGSASITWGASRLQIMSGGGCGGGKDRWLPSAADWHSDTYLVGLKWEVVVSTSVCHFESGTVARGTRTHTHTRAPIKCCKLHQSSLMHITADGVQGVGWGWGCEGAGVRQISAVRCLVSVETGRRWRKKKKTNYLPLAKDENELFDWRVL